MLKNSLSLVIFVLLVCFLYWMRLNEDGLSEDAHVLNFYARILSFFILFFISMGAIFAVIKDNIAIIIFSSISSILISIGILFGVEYSYMSCIIGMVVFVLLFIFVDKDIVKNYFTEEMIKAMPDLGISSPVMVFLVIQTVVIIVIMSFNK